MEHGQLHHLEYYVNDLELSNQFWDRFLQLLDYEKISAWSDGASWASSNGTYLVFVRVHEQYRSIKYDRQAAGLNHIAISCASARFDELKRFLLTEQVQVLFEETNYICFEDRNKFAVEIYSIV